MYFLAFESLTGNCAPSFEHKDSCTPAPFFQVIIPAKFSGSSGVASVPIEREGNLTEGNPPVKQPSTRERSRHPKHALPRRGPWLAFLAASVLLIAYGLQHYSTRRTPRPAPVLTNTMSLFTTEARPEENPPALEGTDKAADLVNRGTKLLERGKTEEAIALYSEALKLAPDDEDVHYNLGLAKSKQGRPDEARQHYEEALRIFPNYPEAHNNLGNVLMAQGKIPEAIEHFRAALADAPDNAPAHNNLGTALARQREMAEAIIHFKEAVRLKPNYAQARFNLGNAYLSQNRSTQAVEQLSIALQLQPNFEAARQSLARARQLQARAP